ncbi:MAG: DUF4190 domain-containing protein [Clostridia bacterium]|nr:DUF4190 domain-containing protein [Clostridia bacterium]
MFCSNCGNEINDNAVICPKCGVATQNFGAANAANSAAQPKKENNVLALVGFILSFFVPIAGLVCSIIGYKRSKNEGLEGKNLALAGIIISAVSIGVSIITSIILSITMIGLFASLFPVVY